MGHPNTSFHPSPPPPPPQDMCGVLTELEEVKR